MALLPLSRNGSSTFVLTQNADNAPFAGATVCVPGDARLTIAWAATDPLPGFRLMVQPPGGETSTFAASVGSATFDAGGGSYFVTAENLSSPSGFVEVNVNWIQQASLYQLHLAPQPTCQAL